MYLLFLQLHPGSSTPDLKIDSWIFSQLGPKESYSKVYPVPIKVDRTILLDFHVDVTLSPPRFTINGNVFQAPTSNFLSQVRDDGINITNIPQVWEILTGETVQIITQVCTCI